MCSMFAFPLYQRPLWLKTPDEDVKTENISWQMCRLTVALWPFEPWPPPVSLCLATLTPLFGKNLRYFCFGCMKCSLKPRFSSTDPSSSAAGCNSHCFWGLNDRHVFHILLFKQMSYSYCERCRCDILSFLLSLAWCSTDVTAWQLKSFGYEWW